MSLEWRKRVQIFLIVVMAVAAVRLFLIYQSRHEEVPAQPVATIKNKVGVDDYVYLKKTNAYDLESSRGIVGKTVWVRTGNQLMYYPLDASTNSPDFKHAAGVLPPLEKLLIKDVGLLDDGGKYAQMMAIFQMQGSTKKFVVSVGAMRDSKYIIFIDDIFFFEDPHVLYKHWPAEFWIAVDHHEVKPGMNELQAALSLGGSALVGNGVYGNRTLQYPNVGKPVTVTFSENQATQITAGMAAEK